MSVFYKLEPRHNHVFWKRVMRPIFRSSIVVNFLKNVTGKDAKDQTPRDFFENGGIVWHHDAGALEGHAKGGNAPTNRVIKETAVIAKGYGFENRCLRNKEQKTSRVNPYSIKGPTDGDFIELGYNGKIENLGAEPLPANFTMKMAKKGEVRIVQRDIPALANQFTTIKEQANGKPRPKVYCMKAHHKWRRMFHDVKCDLAKFIKSLETHYTALKKKMPSPSLVAQAIFGLDNSNIESSYDEEYKKPSRRNKRTRR